MLAALERERLRPEERVRERLQWEDWKSLLEETTSFARWQIGMRFWRGEWGGTLPEGYDANSLASEAVATLLRGEGRLVLGWTGERLTRELKRLVSREVRRLQSLREASRMRSEWDILLPDEEGQWQSVFEEIEAPAADGCAVAMEGEEAAQREGIRAAFGNYLDGDREARGVWGCLRQGVWKRREIASRLGIGVSAVTAARKRLERRVKDFRSGGRKRLLR
jgi:hypothetical protein